MNRTGELDTSATSPAMTIRDAARRSTRLMRSGARPVAIRLGRPVARALAGRPPKRLSAMLRVRNEAEFLQASIESIVELVDEVVVIDNLSDDATPTIIADAVAAHTDKVRSHVYPHRIARSGEENQHLAQTRSGRRSPALLANYYNWCVDRCREPYILKWDGDTVATDQLATALSRFRTSDAQVMWHCGVNLHESRDRLIAGRPHEDMEPRLFFRRFARYGAAEPHFETLWSPYMMMFSEFSEHVDEPLYFHLKFCKQDRFSNVSDDQRAREEQLAAPGELLPPDLRAQVLRLGL